MVELEDNQRMGLLIGAAALLIFVIVNMTGIIFDGNKLFILELIGLGSHGEAFRPSTGFSEQDIVLESEKQIQKYLPEVLGQALARTWIDKRFLDAFYEYPVEVLERGGVYLPSSVSVEFKKEKDQRPKVIVYENDKKSKRKLLELKLVMVAEQ